MVSIGYQSFFFFKRINDRLPSISFRKLAALKYSGKNIPLKAKTILDPKTQIFVFETHGIFLMTYNHFRLYNGKRSTMWRGECMTNPERVKQKPDTEDDINVYIEPNQGKMTTTQLLLTLLSNNQAYDPDFPVLFSPANPTPEKPYYSDDEALAKLPTTGLS
jgi:hypothetical protein